MRLAEALILDTKKIVVYKPVYTSKKFIYDNIQLISKLTFFIFRKTL